MRVLRNILYTVCSFVAVFGTISVLVAIFLYINPGDNQSASTFRLTHESEPITVDEYETLLDPAKPDPRHKQYRHPQIPQLRKGDFVPPSIARHKENRDAELVK